MSKPYDNELRGVLFKNDRKESDTHPDYKGNVQVDGREYWLSAWIKTPKAWIKTPKAGGDKFMSLSLTAKDEPNKSPRQGMGPERNEIMNDDDIPF